MKPRKIDYRDLYIFDDDAVIEEVSAIIGTECPEHDSLIAKLKEYDEQTFCRSLLFVVIVNLLHSYPVLSDLFLQNEDRDEGKKNSLLLEGVFLDTDDDPSQCSPESLKGLVYLILLQSKFVFFRKLKKFIPTVSKEDTDRAYNLLQSANQFRIAELFKIFSKKVSGNDNDSTDSRISIYDFWNFKNGEKYDLGELVTGVYIETCLSEIIVKNNQEIYNKFLQDIKVWGYCEPAFQTYTAENSNYIVVEKCLRYLLIHEGRHLELFFKYVLSQEDLPIDELDLIYEFLAKNHVSALAQEEYSKYKEHYRWPERYFLPDEPIEGAVEDGEDAAREESTSSEMLSENNNGISLAIMPELPEKYIKDYCEQFICYCKGVKSETIEYLFWKNTYDKSISVVKDDIKIEWVGSDVEFRAFIYFLTSTMRHPDDCFKYNSLIINDTFCKDG